MSALREARTLVVKVGSSLVTASGRGLDAEERARKIVRELRWKRPWFAISALNGEGCDALTKAVAKELAP